MLFIPGFLHTDISLDISRGIRCHGVILFRLYYDAKECTFTAEEGGEGGEDVGGDGATTLLINLSRGVEQKESE